MANPVFTDLSNMFKHLYPDGTVEENSLNETVFAKRVKKVPDFWGDQLEWPLPFAPGAGRSRKFATAQANISPIQAKKWVVTMTEDFVLWTIEARAIYASENNRGAFVRNQKLVADMHMKLLGKSFSISLYNRVGGAIGQIAAGGISGSVATMQFAHDVRNFFPNQKIDVSAANDGTAAPRAGGPLTVQSVDYDAGTVTFTAGIVATVAGAIPGDFFIMQDDDALSMAGLSEWIPLGAPGTLFGVPRSSDPQRLGGWRVNNPNGDPAENLITLGQKVAIGGPGPNQIVLVNPIHAGSLIKSLSSKIVYQRQGSATKQGDMLIGATGIVLGLPSGNAELVTDPDCPGGLGWLLDEDTWEFHSLREVPHIVMDDGRDSLRGSNYDGVEVRARYWGNLLCLNPYKNGTFATLV